jgi:hypothetical protein
LVSAENPAGLGNINKEKPARTESGQEVPKLMIRWPHLRFKKPISALNCLQLAVIAAPESA